MARRKPREDPKSPFEWGQPVKIHTASGLETTGKISFIGWLPFPGIWSFEVTTDDGSVYKCHGSQSPGARITRIEKAGDQLVSLTKRETDGPRIEQTEAGTQMVAPGTPTREIPRGKLRARVTQKDGPRQAL